MLKLIIKNETTTRVIKPNPKFLVSEKNIFVQKKIESIVSDLLPNATNVILEDDSKIYFSKRFRDSISTFLENSTVLQNENYKEHLKALKKRFKNTKSITFNKKYSF